MNRAETRRIALATPSGFLAFGLGSGLSPVAPGTVGTVAAIPLAAVLLQLPFWIALATIAVAFLVGVWICGVTGRALGVHDHGGIVWDEFVGLWLVLLFVPFEWTWWLAGFVLFRFFDILKPWPIRWLDRRVHGGFGVMIDDVLAAVYALIPLLLFMRLF
ncbi:MAG: phosphatidylglycerophosphatase A [Wenzhouxiangella sp.]|nr:MAG: phosphatidylglycerophosphatase A [Wenzhouxiangella sp.]